MEKSKEYYTLLARLLRLATVQNVLLSGLITEADALELLNGPLTPDDPTTVVDDRAWINLSAEEVYKLSQQLDEL